MPAQRIKQFSGVIPRVDPRDIPENAAQDATNVFLTSGRIDPMLQPTTVATTRSSLVQTIYRLFNGTSSYWLNWLEQVDVAESPVYVSNNARIAFTSHSFEPRQTDLTLASASLPYPAQWYVLGVTPPITEATCSSIVGGSGTVESRSYVYTYVTQWGEESAPSPASVVTIPAATITGSIADTTLTVSAITSGSLSFSGQTLSGTGVTSGTKLLSQLTSSEAAVASRSYAVGTPAGSKSLTLATFTGISYGMFVTGTGIPSNTIVTNTHDNTVEISRATTAQASGTYKFWTAKTSSNFAYGGVSGATTIALSYMNNIAIGQLVLGTGIPAGATVTALSGNIAQSFASGGAYNTSSIVFGSVSGIAVNQFVTGAGITTGTIVTAIDVPNKTVSISRPLSVQAVGGYSFNAQTITISAALTEQATGTYVFLDSVTSSTFQGGGNAGATSFDLLNISSVAVGQLVSGTGVPAGTTVTDVSSTNKISISNALTAQAVGAYAFYNQGGLGTYEVDTSQTAASTTISTATSAGYSNATWNINIPDVAPANTYTISAATYADGVLTLTLNTTFGLRALEFLNFVNVGGITDLNYKSYQVQSVNAASKQITINITTTQSYVSGGTATRDAPHNTDKMMKRVYRTVTTATGTNFYQVGADLPVATTTFADNYVAIGGQLVTSGWVMPPANLQGVVTHPSGALVGFVGNTIYMSQPYSIYAWPITQTNTLDYTVVGLGITGQSVVVGTEGRPYVLTFTDPAAASAQKLDNNWPCLAKKGITTLENGVHYPSTLGLVYIGASGASLISEKFYAQRDWAALNPSSFIAAHYDSRYYAFHDDGENPQILMFSGSTGISYINYQPTAMYTDRKSGEIYVASNGFVQQLNSGTGLFMQYSWRSKEFVNPNPVNLGACKVDFEGAVTASDAAAIEAANNAIKEANVSLLASPLGVLNVAPLNMYRVDGSNLADLYVPAASASYVSISLYANGKLQFTKVVNDTKVWRFPAGLKYDNYSIGITGTAPVKAVVLGGTPMDLKAV
jgi:hypothetical protein